MKLKHLSLVASVLAILTFGILSQAATCDFAGLQEALRDGADALHPNNPVRYIDFASDAPFGDALARMAAVGVEPLQVKTAWVDAIKNLCGERAANLTVDDVGPNQRLSGLMEILGITAY